MHVWVDGELDEMVTTWFCWSYKMFLAKLWWHCDFVKFTINTNMHVVILVHCKFGLAVSLTKLQWRH